MNKQQLFTYLKDKLEEVLILALESVDPAERRSYLNKVNVITIALSNLMDVL